MSEHEPEHARSIGPERHADADLSRTLSNEVRKQAVDAERRQQQRDDREEARRATP